MRIRITLKGHTTMLTKLTFSVLLLLISSQVATAQTIVPGADPTQTYDPSTGRYDQVCPAGYPDLCNFECCPEDTLCCYYNDKHQRCTLDVCIAPPNAPSDTPFITSTTYTPSQPTLTTTCTIPTQTCQATLCSVPSPSADAEVFTTTARETLGDFTCNWTTSRDASGAVTTDDAARTDCLSKTQQAEDECVDRWNAAHSSGGCSFSPSSLSRHRLPHVR